VELVRFASRGVMLDVAIVRGRTSVVSRCAPRSGRRARVASVDARSRRHRRAGRRGRSAQPNRGPGLALVALVRQRRMSGTTSISHPVVEAVRRHAGHSHTGDAGRAGVEGHRRSSDLGPRRVRPSASGCVSPGSMETGCVPAISCMFGACGICVQAARCARARPDGRPAGALRSAVGAGSRLVRHTTRPTGAWRTR
jgi:hypothetical protein